MPEKKVKRIIWALDPFAKEGALQRLVLSAVDSLTKGEVVEIEPVFALYGYFWGNDTDTPFLERVASRGQKEVDSIAKRKLSATLLPLNVLADPEASQSDAINTLVEHAKVSGAQWIALASHGLKGPKRWILGSFAESLLLKSDVPLLIVNPRWAKVSPFKMVYFPTDFSAQSKEAFRQVLELAQDQKLSITLFHKLITVPVYTMELGWVSYPYLDKAYMEMKGDLDKEAATLIEEAKKAGVKAHFVMDTKMGRSVSDALLRIVKKKPGLIAMAAQSGAARANWIGSVARSVVRNSPFPVWVVHPEKKGRLDRKPALSISDKDIVKDLER